MSHNRTRAFAHKVRTGCQTCKFRRVKCDEERPACRKCRSTNRICNGYNDDLTVGRPTGGPIIQISGDVPERRAFSFFTALTVNQLTGDFDSAFWSRLVLQVSHASSPLRHAAIALGSLHEEFLIRQRMPSSGQSSLSSLFSLHQYTKAVGTMRKSLNAKEQPIHVTLMCSILFFCFESLRGHSSSAFIHLRSGLKILKSIQESHELPAPSKTFVNNDILYPFARFGFQAGYFIDQISPNERLQVVDQLRNLVTNYPQQISSLEEGRDYLQVCLNSTMFSQNTEPLFDADEVDGSDYSVARCARIILSDGTAIELPGAKDKATSVLNKWGAAFYTYLLGHEPYMTDRDKRAVTLLRLHHGVAILMLSSASRLSGEQATSELMRRAFNQVLTWASDLIQSGGPTWSVEPLAFNPDVGVIAPLFYIARNCDDAKCQAKAMELLAAGPRREGVWDADVALVVIKRMKSLEGANTRFPSGVGGSTRFTGAKALASALAETHGHI